MSAVERGLAVVGACTLTIAAFVALACIVERVASLFRFHRPTTEVCRDGWHTAACEKATDASVADTLDDDAFMCELRSWLGGES